MSGQSQHGADLPAWLQNLPQPSEEEYRVWEERQAAREQALDVLAGAMLAEDEAGVAEGNRLLESLPPGGTLGRTRPQAWRDDLLSAALDGEATTQDLLEGLQDGSINLSEDQQRFVGNDIIRLRMLALSIQQDVSPTYLEVVLFREGGPRLTMAARGNSASSGSRLAAWLDEHPELTGIETGVHWHA